MPKRIPLLSLVLLALIAIPLLAAPLLTPEEMKKQRDEVKKQNEQIRKQLNISPQTLTDEQLVTAMKRGIEYLLKSKKNDNWESVKSWAENPKEGDMTGGETALTLLALLEAGKSLDDPRLKFRSPELAPVVDYLTKLQSDRTYVLALQACALSQLPQAKDQKWTAVLTHIKDQLVSQLDQNVGYGYSIRKENNIPLDPMGEAIIPFPYRGKSIKFNWQWDNSNSQYALLAVWAASDAGLSVPSDYWSIQDALWRFNECKSGGWTYNLAVNAPIMAVDYKSKDKAREVPPESVQTPSMTAAGLASLYITQEFLDTDVRLDPRPDPAIAAALKFFSENMNVYDPSGYNLYGIERVGLASGYKYFNNVDWFRQVACTLLVSQQDDGGWIYQYPPATSSNVGTAYALLILARGRNPILFNKLEYYGPGTTWNARPRDTANLTRWASKTFEKPLNWQIVDLNVPAEEWLDAPILVITGSRDPKFTPDQIAKLKTFINHGGTIFSSADGGSDAFTAAIKKIASQVTDPRTEFRTLQKDHPIYNIHYEVKPPPTLLGLSLGPSEPVASARDKSAPASSASPTGRELWIHSPTDFGAAWQKKSYATNKPPFEIAANLYFYCTHDKKLAPRLQPIPNQNP